MIMDASRNHKAEDNDSGSNNNIQWSGVLPFASVETKFDYEQSLGKGQVGQSQDAEMKHSNETTR